MIRLNEKLDPSQTGQDAERLHSNLRKLVVGQDEAIEQVINVYQTYLAGMTGGARTISGTCLSRLRRGTGKTRLVEAAAESLVGDARSVLKIDCAEFQHGHEIAKLIGSPPGYLGHRETHPRLSQELLNQHHTEKIKISFVLFDEIEKASDALWNLLLGVLDKAALSLGDNRRVDFSRAMIFMTSNLGAAEMGSILRPNPGFRGIRYCVTFYAFASGEVGDDLNAKSRAGDQTARQGFTLNFMNRLDKVVVFRSLGFPGNSADSGIELNQLPGALLNSAGSTPFVFNVTRARGSCSGSRTDMKYGARHLKRAIEDSSFFSIVDLIAGSVHGDLIRIDSRPEKQISLR